MIPAMGIDSYWRTRTIAEGQSQGYSRLRAVCSGAGGPRHPLAAPAAPSEQGQLHRRPAAPVLRHGSDHRGAAKRPIVGSAEPVVLSE